MFFKQLSYTVMFRVHFWESSKGAQTRQTPSKGLQFWFRFQCASFFQDLRLSRSVFLKVNMSCSSAESVQYDQSPSVSRHMATYIFRMSLASNFPASQHPISRKKENSMLTFIFFVCETDHISQSKHAPMKFCSLERKKMACGFITIGTIFLSDISCSNHRGSIREVRDSWISSVCPFIISSGSISTKLCVNVARQSKRASLHWYFLKLCPRNSE